MEEEKFKALFLELAALPSEAEWIEVKQNKDNPEEIGRYISALSNSAALCCKPRAYLLWGIDDRSHQIVGTTFRPRRSKVGNEELENWLLSQLEPRTEFSIHEGDIDGRQVVMFEIHPATHRPVRFRGVDIYKSSGPTRSSMTIRKGSESYGRFPIMRNSPWVYQRWTSIPTMYFP